MSHAQEMDDSIVRQHIGLYVNDFSLNLGREGERAVTELLNRAERAGLVKTPRGELLA